MFLEKFDFQLCRLDDKATEQDLRIVFHAFGKVERFVDGRPDVPTREELEEFVRRIVDYYGIRTPLEKGSITRFRRFRNAGKGRMTVRTKDGRLITLQPRAFVDLKVAVEVEAERISDLEVIDLEEPVRK